MCVNGKLSRVNKKNVDVIKFLGDLFVIIKNHKVYLILKILTKISTSKMANIHAFLHSKPKLRFLGVSHASLY